MQEARKERLEAFKVLANGAGLVEGRDYAVRGTSVLSTSELGAHSVTRLWRDAKQYQLSTALGGARRDD